MSRSIRIAAAACFVLAAACADQETPTGANPPGADPAAGAVSDRAEEARAERIARRLATALRDPGFRADLKAELDRSPVSEHKLHFQRYVAGGDGRGAGLIARAAGADPEEVTAEALGAMPLELYLPVPEHRARWTGDANVLVATAVRDGAAPVAFDLSGRRTQLDPNRPPETPVLALVPVETDFDRLPAGGANAECQDCGGDGSGGTGGSGGSGGTSVVQSIGLVMTYASFKEDFEGWLKGAPEFEIHIMGPNSTSDTTSAKSYQCIGEQAPVGYRWNMDALQWSGSVRLFSLAQLNAFSTTYPNRSFLVMALEDDDGPCIVKTDRNTTADALSALRQAYDTYNAVKEKKVLTPGGVQRVLEAGKSVFALISAVASLVQTNDELIGFAIADSISGRYHPQGNWTVEGKDLLPNGWLRLEIR